MTSKLASCCESGNEPPGSIKGWEFLDYLTGLLSAQEGLCSIYLGCKTIARQPCEF